MEPSYSLVLSPALGVGYGYSSYLRDEENRASDLNRVIFLVSGKQTFLNLCQNPHSTTLGASQKRKYCAFSNSHLIYTTWNLPVRADFCTYSPFWSLLFSKLLFFRKKMLSRIKRRTPNLQLKKNRPLI